MPRKITILAIGLLMSLIAPAKKMILPIELVAMQADLIATGDIIVVGNGTYDFSVSD